MFAKVYDVAPDKSFLIAIPKMSENGRKLADLYKISLIEARNQKEAMKALENFLDLAETQSEVQSTQASV
jgi:hypothetical protein